VETAYLAYAMRSPFFLKQSDELTGVLMLPCLRSGLLEKIEIPLPPLDEQRRIVSYLGGLQAKAEAIRATQAETQKELDALMPSVLARAFAGEL
jgi:type I restriction enzyme S subunit